MVIYGLKVSMYMNKLYFGAKIAKRSVAISILSHELCLCMYLSFLVQMYEVSCSKWG